MSQLIDQCTLQEDARRVRREELRRDFVPRIRAARRLPDGLALGFETDAETQEVVDDFVAFEQDCCSFARFTTYRDAANSRLWLEIRGPEGTAELLRQIIPESVKIEDATAAFSRPLRAGVSGVAASLGALLLCATPALPFALGALGIGGALGTVGWWVDVLSIPALVLSSALIAWAFYRRRRSLDRV